MQQVEELRKTFGGAINLALAPVRFPWVATCFVWQTISRCWSERAERNCGKVLDVQYVSGEPWLPNGQQH